ncbi:hypothetical protein GUI37_06100 [Helcococcus kunzii]|uniref:hypothetical protein n=1 Tax=Helcococcus kunzii TaxID=40091 RepID=UPI001BAFC47B|nr:hypothetical protein [Helcococcus kunzii]QUY65112.1 hypothetical protein GUI37_06100 [Helcococcus kunzii]
MKKCIEYKPFKIGKTYKVKLVNTKTKEDLRWEKEAKCIELYKNYGLFQFKNYRECFLYNDRDYLIREVV